MKQREYDLPAFASPLLRENKKQNLPHSSAIRKLYEG